MKIMRLALLLLTAASVAGCIRHRVIVTTEPSEAKVTWNNEYRGRTPIEIPFIYHWKYTLDIEREGCKPVSEVVTLRTRPWFWAPMGLILEAIPVRITDTRHVHRVLEPATSAPARPPAARVTTDGSTRSPINAPPREAY